MVWRSYDIQEKTDDPQLINARGVAFERLAPFGYVRVHGELWRAELMSGVLPVEKGETVQIIGRNNLVLLVKKVEPGDKPLPQPEAQPNSSAD
jgi:membrane-bound ClpP family serine protease